METRTDKIRSLQADIALQEAMKVSLRGAFTPTMQELLDNKKKQLEYEMEMESREITRPVVIQPTEKSWQDSIPRYILISIIILVIGGIIVAAILNSGLFK
jgi:hypothetical protein